MVRYKIEVESYFRDYLLLSVTLSRSFGGVVNVDWWSGGRPPDAPGLLARLGRDNGSTDLLEVLFRH